ncbi:Unknown protein, partial [Striga hermonthica]
EISSSPARQCNARDHPRMPCYLAPHAACSQTPNASPHRHRRSAPRARTRPRLPAPVCVACSPHVRNTHPASTRPHHASSPRPCSRPAYTHAVCARRTRAARCNPTPRPACCST